jgi:hypothetical protein
MALPDVSISPNKFIAEPLSVRSRVPSLSPIAAGCSFDPAFAVASAFAFVFAFPIP